VSEPNEPLDSLWSDDLDADDVTAVYPVPWHAAVAALCLDDPDSWPPMPVVEPVL
jgi:hypothetical protein